MKILIYSAKDFEIPFLEKANNEEHQVKYIPERLTPKTAALALGFDAISIFSADNGSSMVLERLKDFGVKYIALRSTGYDNVNINTAKKLGIKVANTAGYSPQTIAEHAIALLLALNRKLISSNHQVSNYNFSLSNLVGLDINKKTVGIIGTGRIGKAIARIMHGFNCEIIGNDINEDKELEHEYKVTYTDLEHLCKQSDIIFLSAPLNSQTHHLIDKDRIKHMKKEVILINIARGALVHTQDLLQALVSKRIAGYGTDVYEHESGIFFYDHSENKPEDKILQQLIDLPTVFLTPHQAFATKEALTILAEITFYNINCWQQNESGKNELTLELVR
ncbi:D-lactate dehydrogenase [Aquimarina sp. MAR_2010_214]|uniref:2-hydroxyacid dehydrogenase n=1 Tax=Aquimarina sp. MAR_2010_214 TaxID=1250026 RepID=UPI000C703441|nr:2-hydroxyacid dehydrogenase [Aquimarina sp. MAR_2010_214]PKV48272.1 D-lactate dehydrogenase [Aquimarina sp. MAR_2010_214]